MSYDHPRPAASRAQAEKAEANSASSGDHNFAAADASLRGMDHAMAAIAVERMLGRTNRRLALSEALVRAQPVERLIAFDAQGSVLLYLRGDESSVALPTDSNGRPLPFVVKRLWRAASLLHNHPIEERRPIGGTFSMSDVALGERFQISELRVAAVEATYTLVPAPDHMWHKGWVTETERRHARLRAALEVAMTAAPQQSTERDIYFFLRTYDFLMLQLAKGLHMTYRRIDQPGAEWRRRIPDTRPRARSRRGTMLIDDVAHFRWLTHVLGKWLP